jgi:cobalt/nickel transport protein
MRDPRFRKLWFGLIVLVLLTPLGIILPEKLKAGGAWGEWSAREVQTLTGYLPAGLAKLEGLWKALFPDYEIPGMHGTWPARLAYFLTGGIGAGVVLVIGFGLGKWLSRKSEREDPDAP